jgi:hypothetical protein
MKIMTNKSFCYWLQGYFEIAREPLLTLQKLAVISKHLEMINEPMGSFTQWLSDVISFLSKCNHTQNMIDVFLPKIRQRLNLVFYHVIDQSYERNISISEAKKIHDGELK